MPTTATSVTGTWTVTIDRPHPAEDNEGRVVLCLDGREVGFALIISCVDATLWIDTIKVAHYLRGRGCGTRLLSLVLALHPDRPVGLAAPTSDLAAWYARHGFVLAGPYGEMRRAVIPPPRPGQARRRAASHIPTRAARARRA